MDRDYVGISIESYTRYIYDHRITHDGRDNRPFDELTSYEQNAWRERALHQINQFEHTSGNSTYKDRNGLVILEGDVLIINPDDDDWYDVVVERDGKLELAMFMGDEASQCTLESVLDNCEVVIEAEDFMLAKEQADQAIAYLDALPQGADVTEERERDIVDQRARVRQLQWACEQVFWQGY